MIKSNETIYNRFFISLISQTSIPAVRFSQIAKNVFVQISDSDIYWNCRKHLINFSL